MRKIEYILGKMERKIVKIENLMSLKGTLDLQLIPYNTSPFIAKGVC